LDHKGFETMTSVADQKLSYSSGYWESCSPKCRLCWGYIFYQFAISHQNLKPFRFSPLSWLFEDFCRILSSTPQAVGGYETAYNRHSFVTLSFFNKNLVFLSEAEYSYFSAHFRLKIFLWIILDYIVWHCNFLMYLVPGWC